MSYRKIVVDGTNYKYTVGRTHVKIHGKAADVYRQVHDRDLIQ
jgi:hypothetical protein